MVLKAVVVSVVTICVLCLIFFRIYVNELRQTEDICNDGETCVRFCCYNKSQCEDEEHFKIHEKFLELENHTHRIQDLSKDFRILKGIECENYAAEADWRFLEV
jgi:hypothetical protein